VICHVTDTLESADVTTVDGIPVTSPARTLVGLGAVAPRAVGPALNDAVLKGLVTYPWMWRTVGRLSAHGRNGIGVLRAELERHDPSDAPTESMLEDLFVRVARRAGISLPGQVRVGRLRVDFADPARKVIVELDGRRWHDAEADRVRDRRRELQLRAAGWRVIRVRWLDLKYWPELVIAELQRALGVFTG
jgi:very-short-patch-repair endonuclease